MWSLFAFTALSYANTPIPDETLRQGSEDIIESLKGDTLGRKPHYLDSDLIQHDCDHLVFDPKQMSATEHSLPILEPSDDATGGPTHVVKCGRSHCIR